MPNITSILKQEIIRLSRKEIKTQTSALKKTTLKERQDIAELKRQVAKLQGELKQLLRQLSKGVPTPSAESSEGKGIRFTAKGVITHRKRLGLSAADYGKLIGVTGHTVYGWEKGKAKPRKAQVIALGTIRGLGKREAMERLEQVGRKAPARKRKAG